MRSGGQVADLAILQMKLRAIAVAQLGPADGRDLAFPGDFADAAQLFAQDLHLARELKFVGRVLILAASAAFK